MIGELPLVSVFAPLSLVTAIAAGLSIHVVRRLLSRTGFYRFVWHPGLFDLALFIALWSGLSFFADAVRAGSGG